LILTFGEFHRPIVANLSPMSISVNTP
jgi:hypothetical protein